MHADFIPQASSNVQLDVEIKFAKKSGRDRQTITANNERTKRTIRTDARSIATQRLVLSAAVRNTHCTATHQL